MSHQVHLGRVSTVLDVPTERSESADDPEAELHKVLPREAVGEPFQSEGEG